MMAAVLAHAMGPSWSNSRWRPRPERELSDARPPRPERELSDARPRFKLSAHAGRLPRGTGPALARTAPRRWKDV
jgi:hypothetical protein